LLVGDYVDDLIALSEQLKNRFGQKKIYIVGHSWGSIIGMMAVDKRPDLYQAYIGVGQQVNADENDIICYKRIIENAQKAGDIKTIKTLEQNGEPPYKENGRSKITLQGLEYSKYMYLFSKIYNYADTGNYDGMAMLKATEQNWVDKANLIRGLINGIDLVYPQLIGMSFEKDIPRVEVPVYFLMGTEDYTTVQAIAYRYFEKLEAPKKEFYWFEGNGHNNCFEDNERFVKILTEEILLD
jgi:pimeloyl-ACP methyl ester carboxylesterase